MSVSKDPQRGTWTVYIRYVDWQGIRRQKHKRGFRTRRDALEFERDFMLKKTKSIHMKFETFTEVYISDIGPRLRENTLHVRRNMIHTKLLPYFGEKSLSAITPADIIQWQNQLMGARTAQGRAYSQTYLRTIQNLLTAIFNHACRYYQLPDNPCRQVARIGRGKAGEMLFWTSDEYMRFSACMTEKPVVFYAFELLYWCGLREGELLALERGDVDLEARQLSISRSLQRINREDVITGPKTEKSVRVIELPDFLCQELEEYFDAIYHCGPKTRLFETISKACLQREMRRGVKLSGVRRIRIHDLRHSHAAYLVRLGFSPMEIAERLGHESISVTYQYSHLYPSAQRRIADRIDEERRPDEDGAD